MKSMYRIICAVLVAVMVMGMVSAAMAGPLYFNCPDCGKTTRWNPYCDGKFSHNGPYSQHTMDDGNVCNYYTRFFHSNRRCSVCGNDFHHYSTHQHAIQHVTCGIVNPVCPY